MRRYIFRIFIVVLFVILLMDIHQNPEANYTTQIESTMTGQILDVHEEIKKDSLELEKWKEVAFEYTKAILSHFGFDSGKGE